MNEPSAQIQNFLDIRKRFVENNIPICLVPQDMANYKSGRIDHEVVSILTTTYTRYEGKTFAERIVIDIAEDGTTEARVRTIGVKPSTRNCEKNYKGKKVLQVVKRRIKCHVKVK